MSDGEDQEHLSSRSSSLPLDWNFDTDSEDDGLIPKPPGEVGRPSRGGYTLKKELGWPEKDYIRGKVWILLLSITYRVLNLPFTCRSSSKRL